MGNETDLPIRATDASLLCSPVSSFVLKNLLHVPAMCSYNHGEILGSD